MKLNLQHILNDYYDEEKQRENKKLVKSVYFDADLNSSIKWIKKNSIVDKNNLIYRGLGNAGAEAIYARPSKHKRKSANTQNYYTTILDNIPSWKEYPKRSKSLICSTSYKRATSYSDFNSPYVVFPQVGAKFGICSEYDFWDSFQNLIYGDIANFNYYIMNHTEIGIYENAENDFKLLCKLLNQPENKYCFDELRSFFKLKNTATKAAGFFNDVFNPKLNGFKLETYPFKTTENVEVWTDSDAVLLSYDIYKELMENGEL